MVGAVIALISGLWLSEYSNGRTAHEMQATFLLYYYSRLAPNILSVLCIIRGIINIFSTCDLFFRSARLMTF